MAQVKAQKLLFWAMYGLVLIALTVTACQSDPTSIIVKDHGVDTVPVLHTDTIVDTLIDTLYLTPSPVPPDTTYVWCWEIDHNRDGHSAHYQCDNGYRGPLF